MISPPPVFTCLVAGVVFLASSLRAAEPSPAMGVVLFKNLCVQCHGAQGEGSATLRAPSIAGLPAWYVRAQVLNFKAGRRGTEAHEPQALVMAATAKVLQDEHVEALAKFIEGLKPVLPAAERVPSAGALAAGRLLYEERCMECHRYNGTGEVVFGSAPLLGLQEWYLLGQLRKFKSGQRGAVPGDANGAKMVAAARYIESEEALLAVIAYIMTLNPPGDPFAAPR